MAQVQPMPQKLISLPLNLLLPGAGLAYLGSVKRALAFQALFYLLLTFLSLTRLILHPTGWIILIGAVCLLCLGSALYGLAFSPFTLKMRERLIRLLGFSLLSVLSLGLGLTNKQSLLGVQVYFVPSPSMTPTLNPGDFILVDTWAYSTHTPVTGDIVVFQQAADFAVVKRCANWPGTNSGIQGNQLYVLGDNPQLSMDSRKIGGIDLGKINGRVRLKLVTWQPEAPRWQWHMADVH
nr:signal peptidase I [uncultured Pseudomonas sp.]